MENRVSHLSKRSTHKSEKILGSVILKQKMEMQLNQMLEDSTVKQDIERQSITTAGSYKLNSKSS